MYSNFIRPDNRVQELNNRVSQRNVPSMSLQSVFDPRPQNTKYTMFPVHEKVSVSFPPEKLTPVTCMLPYDQTRYFNPGTSAPFNGYANNIDKETSLKNLFESNQRYAIQNKYIPSSQSDMYINSVQQNGLNVNQHVLLNETYM